MSTKKIKTGLVHFRCSYRQQVNGRYHAAGAIVDVLRSFGKRWEREGRGKVLGDVYQEIEQPDEPEDFDELDRLEEGQPAEDLDDAQAELALAREILEGGEPNEVITVLEAAGIEPAETDEERRGQLRDALERAEAELQEANES